MPLHKCIVLYLRKKNVRKESIKDRYFYWEYFFFLCSFSFISLLSVSIFMLHNIMSYDPNPIRFIFFWVINWIDVLYTCIYLSADVNWFFFFLAVSHLTCFKQVNVILVEPLPLFLWALMELDLKLMWCQDIYFENLE